MADRPIVFSAPMVLALLAGRKSRRKIYVRKGENACAPEHLARRLANGLDRADEGECWIWTRTLNSSGYGTLTIAGLARYAHRLAYEIAKGPIPSGMDVMHSCDKPACINPAHLEAGTRSRNMADCHARGRSRIPAPRMKGETNGAAKLTSEQVADVRKRLAAGAVQRVIATDLGVSQSLISAIKRGKLWA